MPWDWMGGGGGRKFMKYNFDYKYTFRQDDKPLWL